MDDPPELPERDFPASLLPAPLVLLFAVLPLLLGPVLVLFLLRAVLVPGLVVVELFLLPAVLPPFFEVEEDLAGLLDRPVDPVSVDVPDLLPVPALLRVSVPRPSLFEAERPFPVRAPSEPDLPSAEPPRACAGSSARPAFPSAAPTRSLIRSALPRGVLSFGCCLPAVDRPDACCRSLRDAEELVGAPESPLRLRSALLTGVDRFDEPLSEELRRSPARPSSDPVTVVTTLLTGRTRSEDCSARLPEPEPERGRFAESDRFDEPLSGELRRSPARPSSDPVTVVTTLLTGRTRSEDCSARSSEPDCLPALRSPSESDLPVTTCRAVSTTSPAVRTTAPPVRIALAATFVAPPWAPSPAPGPPRSATARSVVERPSAFGRDGSGGAVELTVCRSSRVLSLRGAIASSCCGFCARGFGSGRFSISAMTCCAIDVVRSLASGSGAATASSTPWRRTSSSCEL